MPTRIWVYKKGSLRDPKQGYAVSRTGQKKYPWQSEVWYGNKIYRTDKFQTKEEAIDYIRHRKKGRYGGR